MNLLAQLKRRQMFRIAAAYAVVAWLLLQLFNNLAPILELPLWLGRAFVLLLAIGFPAAMFFAWMRELPPAEAAADVKTNNLDWILAGGLAAVIAIFAFQQLAPTGTTSAQQQGVEAAKAVSSTPASGISLAVLPFANLSGDPGQEFFSDGITEEITTTLARVPDLRVVGRTSAYQFKDERKDLRTIGQVLNATHLLEGSVRMAGDRLRITAQLIEAETGVHVWTENYDRQLTDIFVIQESIARAIAAALRVPLVLRQGETLTSNRTDVPAYQEYLRARMLFRSRSAGAGIGPPTDIANMMEQLVASDPNYAPAWALLALVYPVIIRNPFNPSLGYALGNNPTIEERRRSWDEQSLKAEAAAERAIGLDANLADGYVALGLIRSFRGDFLRAEELFSKALELDPRNPEGLHTYASLLGAVGRLKEALAMRQQVMGLEPLAPAYGGNIEQLLWISGQTETAIGRWKARPPVGFPLANLAQIYAAAGRYAEATDALMAITRGYPDEMVEAAIRLLRTAPASASPQSLPRLNRGLEFVYLHVGAPERVLERFEDDVAVELLSPFDILYLWHPSYAPVRKTERFKAFARNAGLVEYWRAKGWPEFCRPVAPERASAKAGPVGADDFVCE